MKTKKLKIKEHQYLSDIMKQIARNAIYGKPTGAGITSNELEAKRNSLLMEANMPVIKGKSAKYNKGNTRQLVVRAVYEGITVQDIIDYIQSDIQYKKIITTPESYPKVVTAFEELGMLDEFYKTYFMLFDECEKTIQDIDYRETIIQPMDDFFRFKNKAFVSATPIIPSDPRFNQQKFQYIIIEPDYNNTQDCNLIVTNNTLYSLQKLFVASGKEQYFIFLNSTRGITTVIKYLDINEDSLIFCSEQSKNKLKLQGFTNAKENLVKSDKFAKYNFFTSRFNSAVDIEGIIDPQIIIITDTYLAEHTKVDPHTEIQQIVGRFRKPVGGKITRYLTHITNVSPDLVSTSKEQIIKDIDVFKTMHKVLINYRDSASSAFVKSVVDEMLDRSEFSKYINRNGSTNYFMIDNAIYTNRVNGYYQNKENLIVAYNSSACFNLSLDYQSYELSDEHKAKLKEASKLKSSLELLLPILNSLEQDGLDTFDVQLQLKQIEKEHPNAYKTFKILGFEKAVELKFNYRAIMAEIAKVESQTQHQHFGFLSYLQASFIKGEGNSLPTIKAKLKRAIVKFNLYRLKPDLDLLNRYFNVSNRTYIETREGKKRYGYIILGYKYGLKK